MATRWFPVFVLIVLPGFSFGQRVGDTWVGKRGDEHPSVRYVEAATTTSGRIVALGDSGQLAISDDSGTSWTFRRIEPNGTYEAGSYSAIYQVPGGELIVAMNRFENSPAGPYPYAVRTYLLTSQDNGNNWNLAPFPHTTAVYPANGAVYYGVNLTGFHMGPGGELLAYGTTTGSKNMVTYWSTGGVIFRRSGGGWVQAFFGYGPVGKVAEAGGRAVAASHNAILDSADGGGWNGYPLNEASVTVSGSPMNAVDRQRLRALDVEVLPGGNYVALAATFVPYAQGSPIDTSTLDKNFTLTSDTPFSGSRDWTAYSQSRYYGPFTKLGGGILTVFGGAYLTGGASFSLVEANMRAAGRPVAAVNSTTAVVAESSSAAWRTNNAGSSWTKVWDKPDAPNLFFVSSRFPGVLLANSSSPNTSWRSMDNGDTWEQLPQYTPGARIVEAGGERLVKLAGGKNISVSDDGGTTWATRTITTSDITAFRIVRTPTGRLVVPPAVGKSVSRVGEIYVSDDNGDTWAGKVAGLGWGELVRTITVTQSGRILVATNSNSVFNPLLRYSDDDGETWSSNEQWRDLDGLTRPINDPSITTLQVRRMELSPSGRLLVLGEPNVILTSDDHGDNWRVRYRLVAPGSSSITSVIHMDSRWIGIGWYRISSQNNRYLNVTLTSDDDGATWRRIPFNTNLPSSLPNHLTKGTDGRVILAGNNGSVYVSDPARPVSAVPSPFEVREGNTGLIPIERPPLSGVIEARYSAVERTAIANTDYVPAGGILTWDANDDDDQFVEIQTIDNNKLDGERMLVLQVVFETAEGLLGEVEVPVSILDDDRGGGAGLVFDGADNLYTTEAGGTAELKLLLERKPLADVVVTVSDTDPTEGGLSRTSFVFTPTDWNQWQTLVITGVDDPHPDGDASYDLRFSFSSTDQDYAAAPDQFLSVVNLGDEPYVAGGEDAVSVAMPPRSPAPRIFIKRKHFSVNGRAKLRGRVTSGVVAVGVKAGKGGFKNARLRGVRFTFLARKLKGKGKTAARIRAATADGQHAMQRVTIMPK